MQVRDATRTHRRTAYEVLLVVLLAVSISACGDNGGVTSNGRVTYSVSGKISDPTAPASTSVVTLELTVAGRAVESTQVLTADDATFGFRTGLTSGQSYAVTVVSSPQGETCTATADAGGTISDTSVGGVVILCTPIPYTLTGSISNLVGTGLIVEDVNSGVGATLPRGAPKYTLYTSKQGLVRGEAYTVSIIENPSNPSQTCSFPKNKNTPNQIVTQVTGNAPQDTDLNITCSTNSYQIGANVSGLAGSGLVLTETVSGQTMKPIADGIMEFGGSASPTPFSSGALYNLAVTTQPTDLSQQCTATQGAGQVGAANVTINVTCTTNDFPINVTVSGFPNGYDNMLITNNATGESLTIGGNVSEKPFQKLLLDGTAYSITMDQPLPVGNPAPAAVNCFVMNQYSKGVVAGAPVNVSVQCAAVGRYLYAPFNGLNTTPGTGAIWTFSIDPANPSSGALTPLQTGVNAVPTGDMPGPLSIDLNLNPTTPNTKFAFLANYGPNTVSAYVIDTGNDAAAGMLSPAGAPAATGTGPFRLPISFDPTGEYAYVSFYGQPGHNVEGGVSAFTVDPGTGELGNPVDYLTGLGAWDSLIFTPNCANKSPNCVLPTNVQYAYQVDKPYLPGHTLGEVAEFSEAFGALVPVPNNSSVSAPNALALTMDPLGRFAYVLIYNGQNAAPEIGAYSINALTGALTQVGDPVQDAGLAGAGAVYTRITVDPSGTYAFLNESASNSISAFSINPNPAPGQSPLTRAPGTPYRLPEVSGPGSVAIDPSGKFAYVLNDGSNSVSAFSINLQTQLNVNALTLIGVYPTGGLNGADPLTIDPSGLFLYVSNRDSGNISGFAIDQVTGALTAITGSPFAAFSPGTLDGPGPSTIL